MIIDDDYCQYEMWRIVNKAEGDAIADFEKIQGSLADGKTGTGQDNTRQSAKGTSQDCSVGGSSLKMISDWVDKVSKCKLNECDDFSEENVAASAYAQKMLELLVRDFNLVVLVNLAAGTEEHFKDTGAFAAMHEEFNGLNFFERCERYAEKVSEEDRERFIKIFNLSVLRKQIVAEEIVRASYSVDLNDARPTAVETIYYPISRDVALKLVRVL